MGLEVVVIGENAGSDEFLLEDIDIVKQVLGLPAADVVNGIWRDGMPVLAGLLFRSLAHDPDDAFRDVIDIGEIPSAVTVVVDLDGLGNIGHLINVDIIPPFPAEITINGETTRTTLILSRKRP